MFASFVSTIDRSRREVSTQEFGFVEADVARRNNLGSEVAVVALEDRREGFIKQVEIDLWAWHKAGEEEVMVTCRTTVVGHTASNADLLEVRTVATRGVALAAEVSIAVGGGARKGPVADARWVTAVIVARTTLELNVRTFVGAVVRAIDKGVDANFTAVIHDEGCHAWHGRLDALVGRERERFGCPLATWLLKHLQCDSTWNLQGSDCDGKGHGDDDNGVHSKSG